MALSQAEKNKNYLDKFTRPQVKIQKEMYEIYKTMVQQKGYDSINDYVNFVLEYDYKNNVIPKKE